MGWNKEKPIPHTDKSHSTDLNICALSGTVAKL